MVLAESILDAGGQRCCCLLLLMALLTPSVMTAQSNPPEPIPARMFSLTVNRLSSCPLKIPYGGFRGRDPGVGQWPDLESCEASSSSPNHPCFRWANLDK